MYGGLFQHLLELGEFFSLWQGGGGGDDDEGDDEWVWLVWVWVWVWVALIPSASQLKG